MNKKQLIIAHGIRTKKQEAWPTDLKWELDRDEVFSRHVDVNVFRYEYINVFESVSFLQRMSLRRQFQKYFKEISKKGDSVSLLAHSLGTRIGMQSMLSGRESKRTYFDLIMLINSVVDCDYPFHKVSDRYRKVINFTSSEDITVKSPFLPPNFGHAGYKGFNVGELYDINKEQRFGVYNTEDLKISHMDCWKDQDKWYPFIINILKKELIYNDPNIG